MPSPLLVALVCAILQWVASLVLPSIPDFDSTTVMLGNIQIITIIWFYQGLVKYIRF
jgi:hypothetical protein